MDLIKEAFQKIKQDIFLLQKEIYNIKQDILKINIPTDKQTTPTQTPTQKTTPTDKQTTPTQTPTQNIDTQALYPSNSHVSIGNRGVPTDKQTNRQTDKQTNKQWENNQINLKTQRKPTSSDFQQIQQALNSLDNAKKAIRLKFKLLTPQEMLVFSTLYGLQEERLEDITYKILSTNLSLSESSIRDYTNKLIKKGIPLIKIRQNNKKITLQVSPDLQKTASLSTIIKLRDI